MYTKPAHSLLDAFISEHGSIRSDADLARIVGVTAPMISKVRNGAPVGDSMRLKFMRKFGMSLKRIDDLAPPAGKESGDASEEK